MIAVILAAALAGSIGVCEQLSRLTPPRRLTLRGGAWKYWVGRLIIDAAPAALLVIIAQATDVKNASEPIAGVLAALATTATLRSSFVDYGDFPVGLRAAFDPARRHLADRLTVTEAVVASGEFERHKRLALESGISVEDIASRLSAFIRELPLLTPAERNIALDEVEDQVNDVATEEYLRIEVLLIKAQELGGESLVAELAKDPAHQLED